MSSFTMDDTPVSKDTGSYFKRDERDNDSMLSIQLRNYADYVTEETVWVWDLDGAVWKSCTKYEEDYIIAKNLITGEEEEHKNSTAFKGKVKKGYSAGSWLGKLNIEREANKEEPYTLEDYEITKHKRVKEGCSITNIKDEIQGYINDVRRQWGIPKFKLCLGEGKTFRDELPLPAPYKGQRDPLRPIFLKEAREWVIDELDAEMAPVGFECDDLVEWYAAKGYEDYKRSGKFSYVLLAEDKDAMSNPKLTAVYTRQGIQFKQPQPVLVEDSGKSVGILELKQMSDNLKLVGSGLKWLVAQAFLTGDDADNYHPYNKLPPHYKKSITYGQTEAYKDFVNLETPQEVLQKAVDNFALWFPRGVQYTDCHGVEQDMSALAYMRVNFSVAYMTRREKDPITLMKLLDAYKVDYSAIEGNNKEPDIPLASEEAIKANITAMRDRIDKAKLSCKYTKSETKGKLQERLDALPAQFEELVAQLGEFYAEEEK